MTRTMGLHLTGISSGYSTVRIVNEVSLVADLGKITAIIGPNGCGKSTLLRTVAGLLPLMAGRIELGGVDLSSWSITRRTQHGMSFVPQERTLFPGMTVQENLALGYWSKRKNRQLQAALATAYEALPDVHAWSKKKAGVLSGGQQRQVELARALMNEPTFMLLDEPTTGAAPEQVEGILLHLRRIADEMSVGVLLVEQNLPDALAVSDDVFSLVNGRNDQDGPAAMFQADLPAVVKRWMSGSGAP